MDKNEERLCVICGNPVLGDKRKTVCSIECRKKRDAITHKKYVESHKIEVQNYQKKYQQQRAFKAQKIKEANKPGIITSQKKKKFKELWKGADHLSRDAMIVRWWRDNRDPMFSYTKYATLKYANPPKYAQIRQEVLTANGVKETKK